MQSPPDRITRSALVFGLWVALTLSLPAAQGKEFYQWTDENGVVHFSDSMEGAPPDEQEEISSRSFEGDHQNPPAKTPDQSATGADFPEETASAGTDAVLPAHEVPYRPYGESGVRRIIIDVTFNDSVTAPMALDTGAPGMLISPSLAEKLGVFDQDTAKLVITTGGIGGTVPAFRTIIDKVQVGDAASEFIPTTVTPSISPAFEGLVGMDFMSNYNLTIDNRKNVLVFRELPPEADRPGGHYEQWWRSSFEEFSFYRTAWKNFRNEVQKQIDDSLPGALVGGYQPEELRTISEEQFRQADRLLDKLNRYAIRHSIPMHWRKF